MFLKAGAISLALLLSSRVIGLLRESAQAAAFGATGLGDVAVLMLTLPDWLAGILASGALAYVLLPAWAGQSAVQVAVTQRRVAGGLLLLSAVLLGLITLARSLLLGWLAPGLSPSLQPVGESALLWSAFAVPAALIASLWVTRLQYERDFVGMYAANLVFSSSVVVALFFIATTDHGAWTISLLGVVLLGSAGVRLGWLAWRQRRQSKAVPGHPGAALPAPAVWLWAVLSSGLPLTLPFVARSFVSQTGEGSLATFNYAWKLVELPLVLAIHLVASLAFPAVSRAMTESGGNAAPALRSAFALAFTLACACAAALLASSHALATLLFGWGRMTGADVARVASWGAAASWGLLPQAVASVALTALASRQRMHGAVWAYLAALALLAAAGLAGLHDGVSMMRVLNAVLALVAVVTVLALGREARHWLPWRELMVPLAGLLLIRLALALAGSPPQGILPGLLLAVLAAGIIVAAGWLGSPSLRAALGRRV